MWLILSDGFLSAVVDKQDPEVIQVRARRKEHLNKYFPTKEVVTHDGRDYQFRVIVNRAELAGMLLQYVEDMQYSNFKDSVKDRKFHDACYDVWHTMAALQPQPPYSNYSKPQQRRGQIDYFGFGQSTGAGKTASTKKRGR